MKKVFVYFTVLAACFALSGCASMRMMRPSRFAIESVIGKTTKQQLIKECGNPYKIISSRNDAGKLEELLYYKESASGVSTYYSGHAAVTHIFTFVDGVLTGIDNHEDLEVMEQIIKHPRDGYTNTP